MCINGMSWTSDSQFATSAFFRGLPSLLCTRGSAHECGAAPSGI
jgi:hypothetical protein